MGSNPLNLALRFVLEMTALGVLGWYGWSRAEGPLRLVSAVAIPLVFAALWGLFAVPGDPSRSGGAPIPVPGIARLLLEIALFGCATWALYSLGAATGSLILGALVLAHYLLSWDRVAWLLRR